MSCSYCHNNTDHRTVSSCPKNVQDRALHIFNASIDPEPHKITTSYLARRPSSRDIVDSSLRDTITLSPNDQENQLWFKDSQGRSPSNEDWNLVSSSFPLRAEFQPNEILNSRYRRIVELLLKFHDLKFRPHLGHVTCSVTYMKRPDIPKVRRYKFGRDGRLNYEEFSGEEATHYLNEYTSWFKRQRTRAIQRRRRERRERRQDEDWRRIDHWIEEIRRLRGTVDREATVRHMDQQRDRSAAQQQRERYAAQQERAQEIREYHLPSSTQQQRERYAAQPQPTTQPQPTDNLPPAADEPIESDCCAICMDPIGKVNCVTIRCGHQFCGDCIFHHLHMERGTCCPLCRKQYAVRPKNYNINTAR